MSNATPRTAVAFDDQASGYNAVAESALGRELRARVHEVVSDHITPRDTVLDVGCGTGLDAAWLSPQVGSVVGFDASPEMVRLAADLCAQLENVTISQGHGASLAVDQPVDVALANFGVVNCVGDLASFGGRLHAALKPSGHAVLVTMPRWCPIELAVGAATVTKGLLTRRSASATYQGVELQYASGHALAKALGPRFDLVSAQALGLVLPPFEQRGLVENRPKALSRLAALDRRLATLGARFGIGDHHIVVVRRRP